MIPVILDHSQWKFHGEFDGIKFYATSSILLTWRREKERVSWDDRGVSSP